MTPEQLQQATGCRILVAARYAPHIAAACAKWGITSPVQKAAFVAQMAHESQLFTKLTEDLHYRAETLCRVWPNRFPTLDSAKPFAMNPKALAGKVYEGRGDLGNNQAGDGWKFIGRGLKQVTGRANYTAYFKASGVDVIANPDLLLEAQYAADSAGWFWASHGCSALAEARDWKGLTKRINGGIVGLDERVALTERALKAFI